MNVLFGRPQAMVGATPRPMMGGNTFLGAMSRPHMPMQAPTRAAWGDHGGNTFLSGLAAMQGGPHAQPAPVQQTLGPRGTIAQLLMKGGR